MSNNPGFKKVPALDLASINKRLNDLWGGIADSGGAPSPIFKRKTILTDAQIKAIPTTPVEVIPTPGPGKLILLDKVILVFKIIAGYTNVAEYNNGLLGFDVGFFGGVSVLALPRQQSIFSGLSGNYSIVIPRKTEAYQAGDLEVTPGGNTSVGSTKPLYVSEVNYVNREVKISGWNFTIVDNDWGVDLGNFTGGNPANTLEVTSFYSIVDL